MSCVWRGRAIRCRIGGWGVGVEYHTLPPIYLTFQSTPYNKYPGSLYFATGSSGQREQPEAKKRIKLSSGSKKIALDWDYLIGERNDASTESRTNRRSLWLV